VEGNIINIGTQGFFHGVPVLAGLSEMLLLVADVMFRALEILAS
jgi:hypothetical protein